MSIILSEKHGVNPSITICLLCGKDVGIALFGKLKNDEEAPKKCCIGELCDDCKDKLASNKEIVLHDGKRYVIISEEYVNPKFINKDRTIFVNSETIDNLTK